YKQDQLPRYNARDVAIKRAQDEGCPVVLGSATPSLESWANARAGRHVLLELTERVGGARLPRVTIVDLARERRASKHLQAIGPTLANALARTLDAGGQAILLLNRRGFANYVACPSSTCGWSLSCDACDASMVLHRASHLPRGEVLRCHHCLAETIVPTSCPLCARPLLLLGFGTQRVEEELRERLDLEPEALVRLDSDAMQKGADYFDALQAFEDGRIRVLLGTQMVAKGLDFPNVRLVGVINADTAIHLPDFRAAERTFQLVSQVAGRSGRGTDPGVVIVQTMHPEHPAIRLASAHDYVTFADEECRIRARAGFPPATRMARIVVRDPERTRAEARAHQIATTIRRLAHRDLVIDGPMPCPITRIAGFERVAIEVRAPSAAMLQRTLHEARATGRLTSSAQVAVDIDPIALL
ncbi:MAG: primosomal protein N', partial [Phycisphaerales bacterium]|nr:primosomal protein N' [Phycisphaerales bacterium]